MLATRSLTGAMASRDPCTVRFHVWGGGARAGGDLFGEVQYIMSKGHIWTDKQKCLKTLPSLHFVGGGNGNIWLKQELINQNEQG